MTFQDLLTAKDEAVADEAAKGAALEAAHQAAQDAEAAYVESARLKCEQHAAIAALLAERGVHSVTDDDGTVTIYTAQEDPPGWRSDHPIPGHAPIAPKACGAGTV